MRIQRLILVTALVLTSAAHALGGTTTVQASGGSVAGINTSNGPGTGTWNGLQQTAYNAAIDYMNQPGGPSSFKLRQGDPATGTGGTGTPVNNNGFYNSQTTSAGTTTTQGKGTVTDGTNGAPTYYDATWQTTTSSSSSSVSIGSGTYDPWSVYARDVLALGTTKGQTADLYYQATLFGGPRSLTGFNLAPSETSKYTFDIGNTNVNGAGLLSIDVFSDNTFAARLNRQDNFEIYLLDPNFANASSITPYQRTSAAYNAVRITDSSQLTGILNGFRLQNGAFNRNLDFGIIYRGFVLTTDNPDQVIFQWTTDNTTQAVPEPASLAALGLGALALLRRRRR